MYLQGEDKLYVNSADTLIKMFSERSSKEDVFADNISPLTNNLAEGRQWLVIPIPSTYTATNWPIRYSAIDADGLNMAVAGNMFQKKLYKLEVGNFFIQMCQLFQHARTS